MAKQCGINKIEGCVDNICFYKMSGVYYARMKSSLTGEIVKKDKRFERTMAEANLLGQASKLASLVYRTYSKEQRGRASWHHLLRQAKELLLQNLPQEQLLVSLKKATTEKKSLVDKLKVSPNPKRRVCTTFCLLPTNHYHFYRRRKGFKRKELSKTVFLKRENKIRPFT